MSKGNTKTSGNKGNNFPYQQGALLLLDKIAQSASTAGLATEGTLISVLNAIVASDQDIEILLVRDTGNAGLVVQQITDYQTGVPVVTYKDVNGNPYVPVGPLEYLDPSAVLNLMLTELLTLNAGGQLLTEAAFVAEDFATETTLAALNTAFGLEDFATETTLALINSNIVLGNLTLNAIDTVLDNIKLDTALIAADTSTLATPVTGLAAVNLRVTGAGAALVAADKRRVTFFNAGNADSTVAGATLKRGEVVTFSADGLRDTLAAITYDALTSELLISTVG
jgi:hypothetical protein